MRFIKSRTYWQDKAIRCATASIGNRKQDGRWVAEVLDLAGVVAHIEIEEEFIRIISARRATREERERHDS